MDHIRHWLFDLDDTLYSASTYLFPEVSKRITERIMTLLDLPFDEARLLQRRYWREYGTSMRGLMVNHGMDPEPFLTYVHDVPVENFLTADSGLRALLEGLPGRRHVFTNSPSEFAERVLGRLAVRDCFESLFDIRHGNYVPKPNATPYERVLQALATEGRHCLLVDDSPANLVAAQRFGITTVWLRSPHSLAGGTKGASVADSHGLPAADVIIDSLDQLVPALRARAAV